MKSKVAVCVVALVLALCVVSPVLAASAAEDARPPVAGVDWGALLSGLLQTALLAVIPVVIKLARDWVAAQAKLIEVQIRSYDPDLMEALKEAGRLAVAAAEQSKLAGYIEDKKAYAREVAQAWLNAKGFSIDLKLIEAEIERQVLLQFPHEGAGRGLGFELDDPEGGQG